MKRTYILIDYENVQPASLALLDNELFQIRVFVGANQTKITFEVASALQRMGARAEYIRISGNGTNALDFHIAFYIGHLAACEPAASFHILSKDAGFDPLICHLRSKKIRVYRAQDVGDMLPVKSVDAKTRPQKVAVVIAKLKQLGAAKPASIQALSNTINACFQKTLLEHEVATLLQELQAQGMIVIAGTKVSYTVAV